MSRVTYAYDEGNLTGTDPVQNISPTQHDYANYGSSFVFGRGNMTSTTRHDVLFQSSAVTSSVKYNTAGAPVSQTDPLSRTVKIGYSDSFNSSGNPSTFAYPTTITDPAGNSSTVKYRYDIGANVEATSPAPAGQSVGKTSKRLFDSLGRLEKDSVYVSTAEKYYTRYAYPTNGVQSQIYTTVVDTNSSGGPDLGDEVYSESWFDGAGRVRQSRSEHPGSIGGWTGTLTDYDLLGRVARTSVPTEVNSSYTPSGDDASRGFIWNYQYYDWKGRVVRSVPSDSNGFDGKDTLITYEGCGCAGGQVTTVQGPLVPRDDQPTVNARRTQKTYADILGRNWKSVVMKWDGASPYSTTEHTFNGRDQILKTKQTDNTSAATPQTSQESIAEYDGHGRIWKTHIPEQRDSANNKFTVTTFNADDSINTITDGRNAVATYSYNNIGLNTQIAYAVPQGSTIQVTPTISFAYDNLGNRTQMIDGTGTTSYQYNQLSQITSETKQFTGLSGQFTLNYQYALAGALKQIDVLPTSTGVTYNLDKTGRVNSVSGQGFTDARFNNASITNLASNIKYRAWNALKSMNYGSPATVSIDYNNRLGASSFRIPGLMEIDYQYNADGRVKFSDDMLSSTFDRSYAYDQLGRTTAAKSGAEASGGTQMTGPYRQTYNYDAFSNLSSRDTVHWSETYAYSFYANYANNRRSDWQYDNDGNMINAGTNSLSFGFDADGQNTLIENPVNVQGCSQKHDKKNLLADGDGQLAIEHDDIKNFCGANQWSKDLFKYNLKSTVLGGQVVYQHTVNNAWGNGLSSFTAKDTRVFLDGKLLSSFKWDSLSPSSWMPQFYWQHVDPMGTTVGTSQLLSGSHYQNLVANLDPMGADVGFNPPQIPEPPPPPTQQWEFASPEAVEWITVDGITGPATNWPPGMLSALSRCPNDNCGPVRTEHGWEYWTAYADGFEGYMPMGSNYAGSGRWSWLTENERKSQRPSLKRGSGKRSKSEIARLKQLGATGIYDEGGRTPSWSATNLITPRGPSLPVDPPGGGGLDVEKVKDALDMCLRDMFNLRLTFFRASERGKNGSVTVNSTDGRKFNGFAGFGVVNDVNSFNQVQIGNIAGGGTDDGVTAIGVAPSPDGKSFAQYSPHINYTANNLRSPMYILAVQIHELGHSLMMITGIKPKLPSRSRRPGGADDGTALETCVFNGEVGRNGQVYR